MKKMNLLLKENKKQYRSVLLKTTITLFFIVGIIFYANSNVLKNTGLESVKVVYIFKSIQDGNKTKEYGGATFDVHINILVGIITREYYDNNESKVKSKYPNCFLYPGIVYGQPKISNNIYVEPYVGNQMQIDNVLLVQLTTSPNNNKQSLPLCDKRGEKCKIKTDTDLTISLQVIADRWSNSRGYSTRSKYKILKLSVNNTINYRNFTMPSYIKFKHLLTSRNSKFKYIK